jgi:hypothetical protein
MPSTRHSTAVSPTTASGIRAQVATSRQEALRAIEYERTRLITVRTLGSHAARRADAAGQLCAASSSSPGR